MTIAELALSAPVSLPPLTRVAVIGAGGPSGLAAVSQLLDKGVGPSHIVGYEAKPRAGGVWNYDESPGRCRVDWRGNGSAVCRTDAEVQDPALHGPSPMYDKLKTNLPKQVMAYHDFPFPDDVPMFPTHHQIAEYLQTFAEAKRCNEVIHYSTVVRQVYHSGSDPATHWTVESQRLTDGKIFVEHFSHIICTNGHYNEPFIPLIPGLQTFKGEIVHSRWWRNAQTFTDKTIVVVGSRASGSDIARELAQDTSRTAKTYQSVRVSDRMPQGGDGLWDEQLEWSSKIEVVSEIDYLEDGVIYLKDGTTLQADVLVFATGYLYRYTFFENNAPFDRYPITTSLGSPSDTPYSGGRDITNLDTADIFYRPDPTLALIGLHYLVNPLPLSECTARLVAHSFVHCQIPALPPLVRQSNDAGDIRIGYPAEYVNQDAWLRAIGEGDASQKGWRGVPLELREMRLNAPKLRRQHLGY